MTANCLFAVVLVVCFSGPQVPEAAVQDQLSDSIKQLRESIGDWSVVTEFLNDDGSVAKSVTGTYKFEWVIPDRVISGKSHVPEMKQTSAILFYINESEKMIEMVSVGADGKLWVMKGPLGGETRTSQVYQTRDGQDRQLRFTRFNVSADKFESKMEITSDGGTTWKMGNHQVFTRAKKPKTSDR